MPRCCEYPRCSATPTARGPYCRAHAAGAWSEQRKQLPAQLFYRTPAWRALSARVLREEPICRLCRRRRARMADHVVERRDGGTDDRANLQGACWPCHSKKTARRTAQGPSVARPAVRKEPTA